MSEIHDGQALLVGSGADRTLTALAAIGKQAIELVESYGDDLEYVPGLIVDNRAPFRKSLRVWEGTIEGEWLNAKWRGEWRNARLSDLPRFGLRDLEPEPVPSPALVGEHKGGAA